jgi:hypothetical protein
VKQPHFQVESHLFNPSFPHFFVEKLLNCRYLNVSDDVQHLLGCFHPFIFGLQDFFIKLGVYLGKEVTEDDDEDHDADTDQKGYPQYPVHQNESNNELEWSVEEGRKMIPYIGKFLCVDLAVVDNFSLSELLVGLFCVPQRFMEDHHGDGV